jgi:hypothetical protein
LKQILALMVFSDKMELVKVSKRWFSDISHTITYDSWDQFMTFEPGLQNTWKDLLLFTWGCKQEKDYYLLQLIYIDLEAKPNFLVNLSNLDGIGKNYIEKRCIQIKLKEEYSQAVAKWLIERDPTFWNREGLLSLQTHE